MSPATILNHEGGHALDYDIAVKEGKTAEYEANSKRGTDAQYDSINERHVITTYEQQTAEALSEVSQGRPTRLNHGGTPVEILDDIEIIGTYKTR